jgi:hypothetical protein
MGGGIYIYIYMSQLQIGQLQWVGFEFARGEGRRRAEYRVWLIYEAYEVNLKG